MTNHGITGYYNGCRCDTCATASAAWRKQRNDRRKQQRVLVAGRLIAPLPTEQHGKVSTYTNWFCRCRDCRTAASSYQREIRNERLVVTGHRAA